MKYKKTENRFSFDEKNTKAIIILLVMIAFFAAAVIIKFSLAPKPVNTHAAANKGDVAAGIDKIKAISAGDVAAIETRIKDMERTEIIDAAKSGDFNKIFGSSVIMGDSHAEGFSAYKLLSETKVAAVKGRQLKNCEPDIQKTIKMKPKNIFINYGMNDTGTYFENTDAFISAYKNLISQLQESLPSANIYVCSIFLTQSQAFEKEPYLVYIPDYNAALKIMSDEIGVGYIDTTNLLTEQYYEPDHVHTNVAYHKLWLNYTAAQAGLI